MSNPIEVTLSTDYVIGKRAVHKAEGIDNEKIQRKRNKTH